jgi:hypothetical protein
MVEQLEVIGRAEVAVLIDGELESLAMPPV